MELLAVPAPERAEENAPASRAEVGGGEGAAATGEAASPEEACPGGKVVTSEQATPTVVEASEKQEAGGDAELFAQAAERIAIAEVAKVLQSAIAEVGTAAAWGCRWGGGAVGACSPGQAHRHPTLWEAAAPAPKINRVFQPCPLNTSGEWDSISA